MRGKVRTQPGYHASYGWFYKPVQDVILRWDKVFRREFTNDTFLQIRRVMESGRGNLNVYIVNAQHRKFVCELMQALDELHDYENIHGWVVRVWPQWGDNPNKRLPTYNEIRDKIIELKGPAFSVDALKQAARRLKMIVSEQQVRSDEASATVD
jgi:hypothetical protein